MSTATVKFKYSNSQVFLVTSILTLNIEAASKSTFLYNFRTFYTCGKIKTFGFFATEIKSVKEGNFTRLKRVTSQNCHILFSLIAWKLSNLFPFLEFGKFFMCGVWKIPSW